MASSSSSSEEEEQEELPLRSESLSWRSPHPPSGGVFLPELSEDFFSPLRERVDFLTMANAIETTNAMITTQEGCEDLV